MLKKNFYLRNANEVASDLLGKKIVHITEAGSLSGIIVETEAYLGLKDAAAHSYKASPDGRTNIQYKEGGYAYIYLIYGMHYCFNVVANIADIPEAVLIRAVEPLDGIEIMKEKRNMDNIHNLCSGPGKLCKALGIDKSHYGTDLCGGKLYLDNHVMLDSDDILTSKRINIEYAGEAKDYLWRYYIRNNKFVSKVPLKYLV